MLVCDMLITAAATSAEIRTRRRNTLGRAFADRDKLSFGKVLLFPNDLGRDRLCVYGKRNKDSLAFIPSLAFAAESDVVDLNFNRAHASGKTSNSKLQTSDK